ncbi:MAG: tetratricopeptide (TPR) repeat protein [Myxococcota bacterium]|jgi:tetratricopeptide (TPR) repeat protein
MRRTLRCSVGLITAFLLALQGCAVDGRDHGSHHDGTDASDHHGAAEGEEGEGEGDDHAHTHLPRRVIPDGAGAPLFNDLGDYAMPISSTSVLAQKYFSQGLVLGYGFNHAEAVRSYKEASQQDPSCGICAWGEAYVLGPNINKPMDDADVEQAYAASQRALGLAANASPVERALIEALVERYAPEPVVDRSPLDLAYANAMRDVAMRFPENLDVQTLFAEASMDTMPWDYYVTPDEAKPAAKEVIAALESVIARNPRHPGALHLYIHIIEPSDTPNRAEFAADQLGPLSPGAGHLVHMPSHIYLRIGRYHDASIANEKAAAADEAYITQCRAQGFYPALYYPHNVHFLYSSSAFEGRSEVSIGAAKKLSAHMTPEMVAAVPIAEEFVPIHYYALARFSRWGEVASLPRPAANLRYVNGVWHYVRGLLFTAKGDEHMARAELTALRDIAGEAALAEFYFSSGSTPAQLLSIGVKVLEARIDTKDGQLNDAVANLKDAVAMQDALPYTEPPPWYFPTREAYGEALVASGRAAEAEAVYHEQLDHTPRNGWSLHGLALSQRAQGKTEEAEATEALRDEVWEYADIEIGTL